MSFEGLPSSGIYVIRNLNNGKCYVGSARNLTQRQRDHFRMLRGGYHHSRHLQSAWNQYGEECFQFFPIAFIADASRLVEFEQMAIDSYRAAKQDCGYNMRPKAESNLGHKFSAETVEKNRLSNTGRKHSEATRALMSAAHQGKINSPIHRKRISIAKTGKKRPDIKVWASKMFVRFKRDEVIAIRAEKIAGSTLVQICSTYSCSMATASYVVRGIGAYYSSI
jgi:group I intron endonuclease